MTAALNREHFLSLVEAGILAPSADNRHALVFDQSGDLVRIWGDSEFHAAPFHRRILSLLSLGAVIENMTLRARSLELATEVLWNVPSEPSRPLAQLRFSDGSGAAPEELIRAIPQRHTNRRFFHGPGLSPAEQVRLEDDARAIAGAELVWLDEPTQRSTALTLIRLAEGERFRSRVLHQELFRSIRFDAGWNSATEEGLAPGSLEVERPLRGIFSLLRHWSVMHSLSRLGMHRLLGLRAGDLPCRLSPHLGVIATTLPLEPGAVAAGRALERVWLRVTCFGMALQPLAASTLYALEGYDAIRPELRHRLRRGWKQLTAGCQPLIVFRVGRSPLPRIRSRRRAASSYVRV